jgi:hypothetical protein
MKCTGSFIVEKAGAIQTDVELNLANSPDKGATTWLIR